MILKITQSADKKEHKWSAFDLYNTMTIEVYTWKGYYQFKNEPHANQYVHYASYRRFNRIPLLMYSNYHEDDGGFVFDFVHQKWAWWGKRPFDEAVIKGLIEYILANPPNAEPECVEIDRESVEKTFTEFASKEPTK